jgi:lysozyme
MASNRYFADISSNNSFFDAEDYRKGGHLLVAIKATQGTSYVNPDYKKWVLDAHNHGLTVLHYHFATTNDPVAEANHFLSTTRNYFGKKDSLVLDLEVTAQDNPGQGYTLTNPVNYRKWFDTQLFRHGHKAILYSYASYLRQYGAGLNPISKKVWVADYETHPQGGWWGNSWAWQFTDGEHGPKPHSCMGVGRCDVSLVNPATYLRLRLGR